MQTNQKLQFDNHRYIHSSLLHLGVVKWNKSSVRLEKAIQYVIEHDSIPYQPVKCLYADIAKAQRCSWQVIERSLRYATNTLWYNNQELCCKLFYRTRQLLPCPCVSEFLCLYTAAFQRGIIQEWVDSNEKQFIFADYFHSLEPIF